jgi:hypothetical protein
LKIEKCKFEIFILQFAVFNSSVIEPLPSAFCILPAGSEEQQKRLRPLAVLDQHNLIVTFNEIQLAGFQPDA